MLQRNLIFHHDGFAASDAATADEVHALGIFTVHIDFAVADAPLRNYLSLIHISMESEDLVWNF